ncbi:hypothetical protein BDP55DRAFT_511288, partial [Colletotrichum godetiae]
QVLEHRGFHAAFQRLSRIPGMWPGLVVGTLHKLISLRCDEELLNYLHFIYDTWLQLAGGNESELEKIDWITVEAVQLRCPRFSASDERALRGVILKGDIFASFGHAERQAVFATLCSFDFPVPSLSTFFKDLGYLERCGNSMKHLV